MSAGPPWLLALDLAGTFAFGLNGALTAVRTVRLDIVGVITLGMITALGGGIIRDILLDDLPPATFQDWRYLAVAAGGAFIAFLLGHRLHRLAGTITVFDAVGLSVFAVTGASKALDFGIGAAQAVILGTITGVGGGTLARRTHPPSSFRAEHRTLRRPRPRRGRDHGRRKRHRCLRLAGRDRRGRGLPPHPATWRASQPQCAETARGGAKPSGFVGAGMTRARSSLESREVGLASIGFADQIAGL